MANHKIEKLKFVSFEKTLQKKLKNAVFKKAFDKEIGRLQLAQDIKVLREKKGMTQKQVAEKTDMPQSVIARIESGRYNVSAVTLYKLADAFNKRIGFIEPGRSRR
jgi:DNA-binding XRE family transcriptional regulator